MQAVVMGTHPDTRVPQVVDTDGENRLQVSSSNITTKFREAFESLSAERFTTVVGTGDIIAVDGNTGAASYLEISKSPWDAGNESYLETVQNFTMPVEISFGASRSQNTLGQEFAFEFVDTGEPLADIPDIAISSITQTTTILTIDTVTAHGLTVGKCIGVKDCSNQVANYPALVVASIPSPTQITCTAGPGGTIPSQTITNPPGAKGSIFFRERFGRAHNGISQIFENASATNASLYVRSESGDALPSGTLAGNQAVTVGSTASVQLVNSPYSYAFAPTTEYRINAQADRIQWADGAIDSVSQTSARLLRTQVVPDPSEIYKLRIRATNSKSLTVLGAKVISVSKPGTTVGTFTTLTPHGLVTGDLIAYYGNSNTAAAAFPNLTAATAVTVLTPTTFTVAAIGTAATVTGYGGVIYKVQGGNLPSALGANAVTGISAQLQTLSDGTRQLLLTGSGSWAGLSIGDYVEAVGITKVTDGATFGVDGAWKVANVVTTVLTLVPCTAAFAATLPANFGPSTSGGAIVKRTCLRVSFVRVFDYERERVEVLARPSGDISGAVPVVLQGGTSTVTGSVAGSVAQDSAIGNPVTTGLRASNANPAAMSATGDSVAAMGTMIGAQVVKPYALPEAEWAFTGALTTTADVPAQTAAGAGLKRHVTFFQATNTGATAVDVLLRDATTTRLQITVPAGQSVTFALPTGIPLTANAILNVALSAVGTVRVNLLGYTAP